MPNLQSVGIAILMDDGHKYSDGDDPNEQLAAVRANDITHDISIISNFRKLRRLEINYASLNGRYPFLFNFPLLQKLKISSNNLKWDLHMLAGLPLLRELECRGNSQLTGNINSLRVLKDTLQKMTLESCNMEGNFMDLADFSRLTKLYLLRTAVTADFQDIGNDDFSKMEELFLGGNQSVSGNIRSLRVLKDTLQKLTLEQCPNVDGNFMALADFPQLRTLELRETTVTVDIGELLNGDFSRLKYLSCASSQASGNIRNLRVLKDTLENVRIAHSNVEGELMDLADFPHLRMLNLWGTAVTGDIRDISSDDFSKIEQLFLPSTIYGGRGYELQRISDAPELMRALYLLKKQHPSLMLDDWVGKLSEDSPDWYDWDEDDVSPPFSISLVEAGTRIGYQWMDDAVEECCEVNWLGPVPTEESSGYEEFLDELQQIESEVDFYKGYHQPPTQEEYIRLVEEWRRLERESGHL
jgi:hypothetical protein